METEYSFCHFCGEETEINDVFCRACGKQLKELEAPIPEIIEQKSKCECESPPIGPYKPFVGESYQAEPSDSLTQILKKAFKFHCRYFGDIFAICLVIGIIASGLPGLLGLIFELIQEHSPLKDVANGFRFALELLLGPFGLCIWILLFRLLAGQKCTVDMAIGGLKGKYWAALSVGLVEFGIVFGVVFASAAFLGYAGSAFAMSIAFNDTLDESKLPPPPEFSWGLVMLFAAALLVLFLLNTLIQFSMPLFASGEASGPKANWKSVKYSASNLPEAMALKVLGGLIALSGLLAFIVGLIFTAPFAHTFTVVYFQARKARFNI
ncbi:MAG: zinc ribbon domain-containing protein [bacterium]|jgi:hypothetical protein